MADLLVIDDDLDGADALAELMRLEGHEVRVGYDGEEGLRLMQERIPEVVIVDVEMPIVGGPAMAYEMLLRDAGLEAVPVVLVSGVTHLRDIATRVGTPYFLGKPYRHTQVVELVRRALAERLAPRPASGTTGPTGPVAPRHRP